MRASVSCSPLTTRIGRASRCRLPTPGNCAASSLAYGVVAVAVPVYDQSQRVVAALNTSSHSKKISKAKLVRERLGLLRELSAQISRELLRVPGLSLSAQN
ncbi:MAG: IclR family transcriptional regulator domain-containing protein [Steroidobacteraceae bacterium]